MSDTHAVRFEGRWRSLAHAGWWVLAGIMLVFLLLTALRERSVLGMLSGFGWTPETYQAALAALRLPGWSLTLLYLLSTNVVRLSSVVVSAVLFWRKPDDGMAYFTSLTLLTFMVTAAGGATVTEAWPGLKGVVTFLQAFGQACFLLFMFVFPTGRFEPSWMRWPTVAAVLSLTVLSRLPSIMETPVGAVITWVGTLWILLSALPAQLYRYARVSTRVQRQQTKLVVFAIGTFLVFAAGGWLVSSYVLPALAPGWVPAPWSGGRLLYDFVLAELQVLPTLALTVALGVAVLRYRLWDIDLIVRRTLIYSTLTLTLALAYFGTVLVLERILRALTGQGQNSLVVVLSTLTIAALFVPLRRRVQAFIDRRFYRSKYDAARTLARFASSARDTVELDQLSGQLVAVVDETMQPAHVSLWVPKAKRG